MDEECYAIEHEGAANDKSTDRMILAEMGVIPERATTYRHAQRNGYDITHGWLRNPTFSLMQYYLLCHPWLYARTVGLYARCLHKKGWADTLETVRACTHLQDTKGSPSFDHVANRKDQSCICTGHVIDGVDIGNAPIKNIHILAHRRMVLLTLGEARCGI